MARLITYTTEGKAIKTQAFTCVKPAVFAGYRSGRDFHVVEDEGQRPLALYWNGTREQTTRQGFPWTVRKELRNRFGY